MLEAQKETFDGWFGMIEPGGGTVVTEIIPVVPVVRSGCIERTGARMQADR